MSNDLRKDLQYMWRIQKQRHCFILVILTMVTGIIFLGNCLLGSATIPLSQFIQAIIEPQKTSPNFRVIIWDIRLPCAIMGICVGGALGLAGAELQTTLHNPLCSPFTLGFSAAAACGASLFIFSNIHIPFISDSASVATSAFIGCCLCALLHNMLMRKTRQRTDHVILCGIALLFSFQAITALMQFLANDETLQNLVFWTMGNLNRPTWPAPIICFLVLSAVIPFSLHAAPQLTLMKIGEEHAAGLGIDIKRLRRFSLLRVSILSAISVAFTGIIGFIGLLAPHMARMLVGENHYYYLPASFLCGALLLSLASFLSQWLIPATLLPTGIVTALIGIPFFLFLIIKKS